MAISMVEPEAAPAPLPAAAEPLAVVGFAFKFPSGMSDSESFWKLIVDGESGLREVPENRFNTEAFRNINTGGEKPKGYFIDDDITAFDAPFFSITAEEAVAMDPQQRLLLETSYHAFENAGIPLNTANGTKTSVHVGALSQDYRLATARDPEMAHKYSATGSELSILSNRLSWFFNLKGPSLTVETACSSSLVALDLACQLLRAGETDMALVAGASLIHMPDFSVFLNNMGFLSPDNRCYSFDSRANGYSRAEGFGVLLVKRVSDAIRDGNTIRAVIRSSGSNSDGFTPGITQPNGDSQLALIKETYKKAGLSMEPTRFCEAHGTGTLLGDPIESHAIGAAFRGARSNEDPLYIGALKASIGHMEAASGMGGIIKSILVLEHGIIPPVADLIEVNPSIDYKYHRLKFPTKSIPWPTSGLRRASVNSFGFGGTNAHVILDDAYGYLSENGLIGNHNTIHPESNGNTDSISDGIQAGISENKATGPGKETSFKPHLLTVSAADRDGVKRIAKEYSDHLLNGSNDTETISDTCRRLAYTLDKHRTAFQWRSCTVINSPESLTSLTSELSVPRKPAPQPKLAFVFTGQGAQWPRMGIELMRYPAFAQSLRRSTKYLQALDCPWNLEDELSRAGPSSRMHEPEISQPLSCAIQIALVDLLERVNIRPAVVIGHSSGEVAAAYCKGAISQRSAMKIAYFRGMGGAAASSDPSTNGTMISVGLGEVDILPFLEDLAAKGFNDLHVACVNSPSNVTIAGEVSHIDALKAILDERSIFARKLKVSCAYHSPHMIPIAKEYFSRAGNLENRHENSNTISMISYLNGEEVSSDRLRELDYWITNMSSPVHFTKSVSRIDKLAAIAKGRKKLDLSHRKGILITNMLEVGPHSALKGPLRDIIKTFKSTQEVQYDTVLVRGISAVTPFLQAVGSLQCSGFSPDTSYANSGDEIQKPQPLVDLPKYPFAHTRSYWNESQRSLSERLRQHKPNELLGTAAPDWQPYSASWRNFINRSKSEWVDDHVINDTTIYPGAGMVTMAIEAMNRYAEDIFGVKPVAFALKDVEFIAAMIVPEDQKGLETQIHFKAMGEGVLKPTTWFEYNLFSTENGQWKKNSRGQIRVELDTTGRERSHLESNTPVDLEYYPTTDFYGTIAKAGYMYGPTFQRIEKLRYSGPAEVQAVVKIYDQPEANSMEKSRNLDWSHIIHPTTLDNFLQIPIANISRKTNSIPTMIPVKLKKMWVSSTGLSRFTSSTSLNATTWLNFYGYRGSEHSVTVTDSSSEVKLEIQGYDMARVSGGEIVADEIAPTDLHTAWRFDWEPLEDKPKLSPEETTETNHYNEEKHKANGIIPKNVEIHVHNPPAPVIETAHALQRNLEAEGHFSCKIVDSGETLNLETPASLKIILWDMDRRSVLDRMMGADFEIVKKVLSAGAGQNVLWIQTADVTSPYYASQHLIDGLSRVLRMEQSLSNFATLSTSSKTVSSRVKAISRICESILGTYDSFAVPQTYREMESGVIQYAKLKEVTEITQKLRSVRAGPVATSTPWDINTPVKINVGSPGVLDTIHFVQDMTVSTPLQDDEVEVEVKAVGLNFKDCLIALGALNENSIGSEMAGIVTRIGSDTKGHGLVPGTRVCGFAVDGYRTLYRNKAHCFSVIPDSLSFIEAASIPINFATAWHSIRYVAQLSAGETVLIHSAAGGTGQAAIQIAKFLGATVFATVGTQDKRELLTTEYGIPPENIFNSRDTTFAKEIKRLTGGQGVDVVFNSLSGDILFNSWDCLAPFGRFVEIGKKDIQAQSGLPMAQFEKNCSFSAVDLGHMFLQRPRRVTALINEVLSHFEQRNLRTVHSIRTFEISEVIDAFRLMQGGKSSGKIVVEVTPQSHVPAIIAIKEKSTFDADATYVIAGGLGGIGRDIARWMADRGAKNLLLLSRSGPKTEVAKTLVTELKAQGVSCITPACDISNLAMLRETMRSFEDTIPPIKGCIQASMVLRSALFADMKPSEWNEATASKVAGSWNLHEILPSNLDFFVMLSSVQALVGSRTQSNYASANSYMDALAKHRISKGLKAISIQLGAMESDGYLTEHNDELQMLIAQNYLPVRRNDFHALLDQYCDAALPIQDIDDSQITMGLQLLHTNPEHDPLGTIWARNPMFDGLRRLTPITSNSASMGGKDIPSQFTNAKTTEDATGVVITALTQRLASTIAGMDPEEMDHGKSVQAYGVDSLQTMELRSWFLKYFKSDVPTFEILGAASLTALAGVVVDRSSIRK